MFLQFLSPFKKTTLSGVIVLLVLVMSFGGKFSGQASSGASEEGSFMQLESAVITENNELWEKKMAADLSEASAVFELQKKAGQQEENDLQKDEEESNNTEKDRESKPEHVPVKKAADTSAPKNESPPVKKTAEKQEVKPEPAPKPEVKDEKKVEEVVSKPEPTAPVTFSFGSTRTVRFRAEVEVTNNGSEAAKSVQVSVPMLENNSPYQKTSLTSTSYPVSSSSGRISTFRIGGLEPGETKTIVCDYSISIRPVSINSTNQTVEKAREAYNRYAGSGNCHTLAVGFVNHCRSLGVEARVVTGFARSQRGNMTSGSLAGSRHSWAEFRVEGLGWVPVDLTFNYFGNFPHASHVVETYNDQSIRVRHAGGSLNVVWKNSIL